MSPGWPPSRKTGGLPPVQPLRRRCLTTADHRITQCEIKGSERCAGVTNASPSERAMHGGKRLSPRARTCTSFAPCDWRTYRTCRTLFCAARPASANSLCVILGICPRFCSGPHILLCCARQTEAKLKQQFNPSDTPLPRLQSVSAIYPRSRATAEL